MGDSSWYLLSGAQGCSILTVQDRLTQRMILSSKISVGPVGGRKMTPRCMHVLISRAGEYCSFCDGRDLADVIRVLGRVPKVDPT